MYTGKTYISIPNWMLDVVDVYIQSTFPIYNPVDSSLKIYYNLFFHKQLFSYYLKKNTKKTLESKKKIVLIYFKKIGYKKIMYLNLLINVYKFLSFLSSVPAKVNESKIRSIPLTPKITKIDIYFVAS